MAILAEQQIDERLAGTEWRRGEGAISRDVKLPDFAAAITLVNRVAALAEERNHHPDILVHGWNNVRLTLSTHSEGGVTDADIELAQALDALL